MKPHVVFYHAHCTDGYGAAFAAWVLLGDSAEYIPCNYGDEPPLRALYEGRHVHIVDFSFSQEITEDMITRSEHFIWLDHHKTAFEMWCLLERELFEQSSEKTMIRLDNSKSGARLAWEYYCPQYTVPELILCIDDRDRWQFGIEHSKAVHAALQAERPWSFEQWKGYTPLVHNSGFGGLITKGRTLLRNNQEQVNSVLHSARDCAVKVMNEPGGPTFTGRALNCPLHMSEIGHELAKASGTYGLVWYMGADGKAKCSFRSQGEYDVSRIAKAFGGGGHRNAAGCEVPMFVLQEWLR